MCIYFIYNTFSILYLFVGFHTFWTSNKTFETNPARPSCGRVDRAMGRGASEQQFRFCIPSQAVCPLYTSSTPSYLLCQLQACAVQAGWAAAVLSVLPWNVQHPETPQLFSPELWTAEFRSCCRIASFNRTQRRSLIDFVTLLFICRFISKQGQAFPAKFPAAPAAAAHSSPPLGWKGRWGGRALSAALPQLLRRRFVEPLKNLEHFSSCSFLKNLNKNYVNSKSMEVLRSCSPSLAKAQQKLLHKLVPEARWCVYDPNPWSNVLKCWRGGWTWQGEARNGALLFLELWPISELWQ